MSINILKKGFFIGSLFSLLMLSPVYAEQGIINGNNVNVRQAGSANSDVYTQLNNGQAVTILSIEGDYFKISVDDSEKFVSKDYISVTEATGSINSSAVNIRKYPSTNHEVLSQADSGDTFKVSGISGDWVNIDFNGESAFVHKDFINCPMIPYLTTVTVNEPTVEAFAAASYSSGASIPASSVDVYAVINSSDGLNLRALPSMGASVIAVYTNGTSLDIIGDYGDWFKVSLDGLEGYVSKEFISVSEGTRPDNSVAQEIISYAKQFLGTPYAWGGTSLSKGVDCSGFVYSVMKNFGISLNRSSRDQIHNGYSISKSELQMGDLVFFDTDGANNGRISHVGIYISDGQFIHSSSSKRTWGVTVSSLYEDYYILTYVNACRIL